MNLSKRVRKDGAFLGLAGLLLGISLRLHPWKIFWSSPAIPRKTPSFPPLLIRLTQYVTILWPFFLYLFNPKQLIYWIINWKGLEEANDYSIALYNSLGFQRMGPSKLTVSRTHICKYLCNWSIVLLSWQSVWSGTPLFLCFIFIWSFRTVCEVAV